MYSAASCGTLVLLALASCYGALGAGAVPSSCDHDDVVDLGYQRNQGHFINDTLITFRNVRYAAAPLGGLRFQAPSKPLKNRTTIQDHADVICPQAYPNWLARGTTDPVLPSTLPPTDPRTSEDCLFLDVLMPRSIWDNRHSSNASVLVWIPGGGFDVGWKDASGAGLGLVSRSVENRKEGVILVSMNYRLGIFGWMHGNGVTSNAGLKDQRFALDWVQKYIGQFGGNKNNVTILAESAGAGSLVAHITAYGGTKHLSPFEGAIVQSPFYPPTKPDAQSSVDAVLAYSNATSLQDLQGYSSERLQLCNSLLIANARPFGNFIFSIVVDGDYVPDLPTRLLLEGRFDHSIAVMTGHNSDEGSRFVSNAQITDEAEYENFLVATFPPLLRQPWQLTTITKVLYPPIFDGSQGYLNQAQRTNMTIGDAKFVCTARALDSAPLVPTIYAYEYTVPPAIHGADLDYTFYDFGTDKNVNITVALALQQYITNFAQTANPNGPAAPAFPPTEGARVVQNVGPTGFGPMPDENGVKQLATRCAFWQSAPYLAPNPDTRVLSLLQTETVIYQR